LDHAFKLYTTPDRGDNNHHADIASAQLPSIQPAPKQKLKSSVQRALRQSLTTTYPLITPYIDEVLPKKGSLESMKLPDRNTLYVLDSEPLFFQNDLHGNLVLPHLKLVHRFPQAFPTIRIDRGAIRFVLSGATLMAPGLTSKGGRLPKEGAAAPTLEEGKEMEQGADEEGRWSRELDKGEPVIIMAEGKKEACAVGVLVAGTAEVKSKGKGPVVEEAHFLGDGLWNLATD
jgi:PUA domain protein